MPLIAAAVEQSAQRLGLGCRRMPSGAGHDAMYLAQTGLSGMIFIPWLLGSGWRQSIQNQFILKQVSR